MKGYEGDQADGLLLSAVLTLSCLDSAGGKGDFRLIKTKVSFQRVNECRWLRGSRCYPEVMLRSASRDGSEKDVDPPRLDGTRQRIYKQGGKTSTFDKIQIGQICG